MSYEIGCIIDDGVGMNLLKGTTFIELAVGGNVKKFWEKQLKQFIVAFPV